MGVTGLWQILESVGHPIKIEALEGKRLGVDANIWLYKFIRGFREKDNATSIDSHKLGLYNRISKLLFYKIKPIFVFDGPAPVLKRRTLEKRQNVRNKSLAKVQDKAIQLLAQQLKEQYPDANLDELRIRVPELQSHGLAAAEKLTDEDRELFYIPPETRDLTNTDDEEDDDDDDEFDSYMEWNSKLEALFGPQKDDVKPDVSKESVQQGKNPVYTIDSDDEKPFVVHEHIPTVDIESADFKSLPAEVRYEILKDIKDERKKLRRAQNLPDDANSFSNLQLDRLKARRAIQEKIEQCEKDICSMYTGELGPGTSLKAYRVQSDAKSTMLLSSRTGTDCPSANKIADPFGLNDTTITIGSEPQEANHSSPSMKVESNVARMQHLNSVKGPDVIRLHFKNPKKNRSRKDANTSNNSQDTSCASQATEIIGSSSPRLSDHSDSETEVDSDSKATDKDRGELVNNPPETRELTISDDDDDKGEKSDDEFDSYLEWNSRLEAALDTHKGDAKADNEESVQPENVPVYTIDSDDEKPSTESVVEPPAEIRYETVSPEDAGAQLEVERSSPLMHTDSTTKKDEPRPKTPEQAAAEKRTDEDRQLRGTQIAIDDANSIRNTNRVTTKVVDEAKELLRLFGVPYIDAAGEAEAQCALLEKLKLTEGTITDDSDVWLFGSQNVYRYFFSDDKYVMHYKMSEIEFHLRLTREHLVCFAMLVGSDYTEGIMNVGPVTALEILSEFPGENMEPLTKFRNWKDKYNAAKGRLPGSKRREKLLKFRLPEEFPSRAVYDGYLRPMADNSTEEFTWGVPDLHELREYARRHFGWDSKRIDDKLLPVMKRLNERRTQTTIDSYFFKTAANQNPELFRSKRVNSALTKMATRDEVMLSETDEEDQVIELEPKRKTTTKRRTNKATGSQGNTKKKPRKTATKSRKSASQPTDSPSVVDCDKQ